MFYLRRTLCDHAVELLPSGYLRRTTPVDSTAVCTADSAFRIFGGRVSGSETWAATIKDSEEYFTKTTTVRALKAAHAESLDDEVRDFTNALSAVQTAVESTGVVLRKYPEGSSSTA
jgi:hypothetical protein